MVGEKHQETSRELKIFKGFLKLANVDINIVLAERAKTQQQQQQQHKLYLHDYNFVPTVLQKL